MKPRHQGQGLDRRHGERGSLVIMTALVLPIVMLIVFGAIDIAHAVYVQRHLQKIADMAAIAGAENITDASGTANSNAQANGFSTTAPGRSITVSTGNWNPKNQPAPTYFSTNVPTGSETNAVQVQVSQQVPYFLFLGPPLTLHAQAIAWAPSMAGFTVSSQLLSLNTQQSAVLNALLGGLLGTHLNLGVAGYNGLLSTNITLGQLAQALHVGTVNGLLQANLNLPILYQGMLTALSNQAHGGVISSDAQGALQQLVNLDVPGSYQVPVAKLLNITLAAPDAAADAQVNLLNLITTSAMVANQHHFISIPDLGVHLGGLVNLGLGLQIISPPSIAFGEAGQNPDGTWKTQAHSAQVALALHLQVLGALDGGVLNVPIYLEVDPAQAHLTKLTCSVPQNNTRVHIGVNTGVLTAVIGDVPKDALDNTTQPLSAVAKSFNLVNVLNLIKVTMNPLTVPLSGQVGYNNNTYGYTPLRPFIGVPSQNQTLDTNGLGNALGNTLQALQTQMQKPGAVDVQLLGILNLPLGNVVGTLLAVLNPLLIPLTHLLNDILAPVLQLLGIQLGIATVNYNALSCGNAVLVY
ncbi:TadG family pilus assembly protein [Acidithiobacillus sp. M4-SHS-6]|uniref:TadG family pilus assembly protein n=1 Tax=Acidithiobacillus sp. M4-SHS-6 TaxID=3383024 RepID=UPI0039BE1940